MMQLDDSVAGTVRSLESDGKTTMIVGFESEIIGVLAVTDPIRPDAAATIQRLKEHGIRQTLLLTGDNQIVGEAIARQAGIDVVRAGLMPEDKVKMLADLAAGDVVAMVGDGVNDAPALASASVGIAMGGAGTDVALETADIALMGDELAKLPFAVSLGRKTRAIVYQNLAVSIATICTLLALAVTGVAGISLAIVFHEGSTIGVVLNALRLLAHDDQPLSATASPSGHASATETSKPLAQAVTSHGKGRV